MSSVRHVAQNFNSLRAWRHLTGPADEAIPGCVLRVLQYNILADSLADGSDGGVEPVDCVAHFRVPGSAGVHYYQEPLDNCHVFRTAQHNLLWERRLPMLLEEIRAHAPDIICLQEVDHFLALESALQSSGYSGQFFKKKGRNISDGSAIFWRTAVLNLDSWKGFHLGVNVMTALVLRLMTSSGVPVVVCSTHLKAGFSQEMELMRSKQVAELIQQVINFAGSDAIVLGADLNAHCSAYHRCTAGKCCDPEDVVEPVVVPSLEASGFRNAYGEYPSFTTWGGWLDRDVKATLDYIMIAGPAAALSAFDLPADEAVADHPDRLPNESCASDHLCLVVDISLQAEVEERGGATRRLRRRGNHSSGATSIASGYPVVAPEVGNSTASGKSKSKGRNLATGIQTWKPTEDRPQCAAGNDRRSSNWDDGWNRSWSGSWNERRWSRAAPGGCTWDWQSQQSGRQLGKVQKW